MKEEEIAIIHNLIMHPGWGVLREQWKRRFIEKLQKLRTYKRDDAFYRCQGYLDCIEEFFEDIDLTVNDSVESLNKGD